jgi:methionyl-tRNA synthetase
MRIFPGAIFNNELADVLGNFINRTLTFIEKHFGGEMPEKAVLSGEDEQLQKKLKKTTQKVGQSIDRFQIRQGLRSAMDLARYANKYFNDQQPWQTVKTDRPRCATTLALCVDTIDTLSVLLAPYIPFTAGRIRALLNTPPTDIHWDQAGKPSIAAGHRFNKPAILFTKIEDDVIEKELKKLKKNEPAPGQDSKETPTVSIEEFSRLDLRVAEILSAEKVAKTDKLMKLRIKVGSEERQIIAGIAGHYQAETLPGKQIVIVANLQPAKIRNEESEGMLLAAKSGDQLTLIMPSETIPPGAKIS